MLEKEISGFAFDMDGVLVDTEGNKHKIWNIALQYCYRERNLGSAPPLTFDHYTDRLVGHTGIEIATRVVNDLQIPLDPEELFTQREELMNELYYQIPIVAIPGNMEFLRSLREDGYDIEKLALVASEDRKNVRRILKSFDLYDFFDVIVAKEDVEHWKPHPEPYLKAAERLDENPSKLIAIEDTEAGIISAKKAGYHVIAVPNPYGIKSRFEDADYVATQGLGVFSANELVDLVLKSRNSSKK